MNPITYDNCIIHFVNQDFTVLNNFVEANNYSKIFVLVDENTHNHCVAHDLAKMQTSYRQQWNGPERLNHI